MRLFSPFLFLALITFLSPLEALERSKVPCNPSYGRICKDEVPTFWAHELSNVDLAQEMIDLLFEKDSPFFPHPKETLSFAVVDTGLNEQMMERFVHQPKIKLGQYETSGEFRNAIEEGKFSPERFVELMDQILEKRLPEDELDITGELTHSHRTDPSGHGTMVSGLIAGHHDFGVGRDIHLTVYGVQDYLDSPFGPSPISTIGRESSWPVAVYEACRDGAQVINLSWSIQDRERELRFAETHLPLLDYLHKNGCLLVKAAGNREAKGTLSQSKRVDHPALINLAGVQINGSASGFSNAGTLTGPATEVGVLRPINFQNIKEKFRCQDEECVRISGTSFAAPIATGTAGLLLEVLQRSNRFQLLSPSKQVDLLKSLLNESNQNQPGELDAARAVQVAIHWSRTGTFVNEFLEHKTFCETTFDCMNPSLRCNDFRDCVRDLRFQVSLCSENRVERLTALGDLYLNAKRVQEASRWYNQAIRLRRPHAPSHHLVKATWSIEERIWEKWSKEDYIGLTPSLSRTVSLLKALWKKESIAKAKSQFSKILDSQYFHYISRNSETRGSADAHAQIAELYFALEEKAGFANAFSLLEKKLKISITSEGREDLFWDHSVAIFPLVERLKRDDEERRLPPIFRSRLIATLEGLLDFFYYSEEALTYLGAIEEGRRPWNALLYAKQSKTKETLDAALHAKSAARFPSPLLSFLTREGRHISKEKVRELEHLMMKEIARNFIAYRGNGPRLHKESLDEAKEDESHLLSLIQTYVDHLDNDFHPTRAMTLGGLINILHSKRHSSHPTRREKLIRELRIKLARQLLAAGPINLSLLEGKHTLFKGGGFKTIVKGLILPPSASKTEEQIDYFALARLVLKSLEIVPGFLIKGHQRYAETDQFRSRFKRNREYLLVKLLQGSLFYVSDSEVAVLRFGITPSKLANLRIRIRNLLTFDQNRHKAHRSFAFERETKAGLETLLHDPVNAKDHF